MERHIRILAWLYLAHSALILLGAFGAFVGISVGGLFSGDVAGAIVSPIVGLVVSLVITVLALPSLLAGWGLLEGKGWARVLTMVLGFFHLFSFPLGTALGIYTFWTLWGQDSDPYFERHYVRY